MVSMKIMIVLLIFFITGCTSQNKVSMNSKLDAPLRHRMSELEKKNQSENLLVLGECATSVNDAMRKALVDAGADLQSTTKNIFVAQIPSDKLSSVAVLEFVTQLQLSQVSKLLQK